MHLLHITCYIHLTTTLCRFSYYENHRRLSDAALRGLVIDEVKKKTKFTENLFD